MNPNNGMKERKQQKSLVDETSRKAEGGAVEGDDRHCASAQLAGPTAPAGPLLVFLSPFRRSNCNIDLYYTHVIIRIIL